MSSSVQPRREDHWDQYDEPESADSRPSNANRADHADDGEESSTGDSVTRDRETIPYIIEMLREDYPALAKMAISMNEGRKLRRECTREIRGGDGSLKSRIVAGVMKEFLRWYYDTEESKLQLESTEGRGLLVDLPNSYNEEYGEKWYGKLKDVERQMVRDSVNPHTAMLSFTASSTTDDGMHRPPGDHLRGLQDSWGDFTRRELQRALTDAGFGRYKSGIDYELANGMGLLFCGEPGEPAPLKWWEYITIVEPHGESGGVASGYGHFHTGIFASHHLDEEMFHSTIDKHVEACEYAERAAHDYHHEKSHKRPISVNRVAPGDEDCGIGNLGSYLAEYIGGFSGEPPDRPIYELVFQSVVWSTGTQRVRASNGANKLAAKGRQKRAESGETEIHTTDESWTAVGIENVESGESRPVASKGGCKYMVPILDGPPTYREPDDGLPELPDE